MYDEENRKRKELEDLLQALQEQHEQLREAVKESPEELAQKQDWKEDRRAEAAKLRGLRRGREELELVVKEAHKQLKRAEAFHDDECAELQQLLEAEEKKIDQAEGAMLHAERECKNFAKQAERARKDAEQLRQREEFAKKKQEELTANSMKELSAPLRRASTLKTGKKKPKKKKG